MTADEQAQDLAEAAALEYAAELVSEHAGLIDAGAMAESMTRMVLKAIARTLKDRAEGKDKDGR